VIAAVAGLLVVAAEKDANVVPAARRMAMLTLCLCLCASGKWVRTMRRREVGKRQATRNCDEERSSGVISLWTPLTPFPDHAHTHSHHHYNDKEKDVLTAWPLHHLGGLSFAKAASKTMLQRQFNLLPPLLLLLLLPPPPTTHAFLLSGPSSSRQRGASSLFKAVASSPESSDGPLPLFRFYFQGEFDNAAQVASERAQGMEAGPAGGHEHIHCILKPLDLPAGSLGDDSQFFLGATYYFDNRPEAVFRCRVYSFHPPPPPANDEEDEEGGASFFLPPPAFAEMRLHRFTPEVEGVMRQNKYDLALLPQTAVELAKVVEELEGCSILWSVSQEDTMSFRGVMRDGYCLVQSQREAEIKLKIEDDLLLTKEMLSVNDRGTDCGTGKIVYGNYRGLSYCMERRRQ